MVGLVEGNESVAQLAERLGFTDAVAFTRAFRRWTDSTRVRTATVAGPPARLKHERTLAAS